MKNVSDLQSFPSCNVLPGKKVLQYGGRRAEAYNKTTKKCSTQLAQIYDLLQTKANPEFIQT